MSVERPRSVNLALGGGAARGIAHVGVLKGLAEDGIEIAGVAGTSMGSIVGALTTLGLDPNEIEAVFDEMDWQTVGGVLVRSVIGTAFHDLLREILGPGTIESLSLPFGAVCCDIETGEQIVLSRGSLADSVRASSAIPGILSPMRLSGRTLVDGAVVEPVPIGAAAGLGDPPVLAVNVLRPPIPQVSPVRPMPRTHSRGVTSALRDRLDRWLRQQPQAGGAANDELPNRWETVMRSFHIMQYQLAASRHTTAQVIEPEVGRFGWFDFHRATEIVDEGYRAYRRHFPRGS